MPSCIYRGEKVLACFLSNTCMGLGVNVLSTLEIRGEGVQWNNAGSALSQDDPFNLGAVYGMLILDSIIYMTIAWSVNLSLRLTVNVTVNMVLGTLMQYSQASTGSLNRFISLSHHPTGWVGQLVRLSQ